MLGRKKTWQRRWWIVWRLVSKLNVGRQSKKWPVCMTGILGRIIISPRPLEVWRGARASCHACHVSEHYLLYLVSGLARKVETLLVRAAKQQHFGTTILKWEKHGVNEVSLELQTIHWFLQSRRRPLLGPPTSWKRLLELWHFRHY